MLISGFPWVVGRNQKEGDIHDVSIETTAEGLNRIQIARDAKNTDRRLYVVDRKVLPSGAWKRLLEAESFSVDPPPDRISEVRALVEFETIPNAWGIEIEKTWGIPAGMESPWIEPLEMVGNELLVPLTSKWLSGDAPVNVPTNDTYRNGKYSITIQPDGITISDATGEFLGKIFTDTSLLRWTEGIAGAASFNAGFIFIEPAKPPVFMGRYTLDRDVTLIQPGLYRYGDNYIISNTPIRGRSGVGMISILKDPYPQRWVPRMFGRAYVQLVSPANVPPLIEEEPSRIGIAAYPVPTDYDIEPKWVTAYSNKVGVFNAWDVDISPVYYAPRERPYDILIPFDGKVEDWGGYSVWHPGTFFPALDSDEEPNASFPTVIPYEMPNIPEMYEGTMAFKWKDSSFFDVVRSSWLKVFYRDGYIYFESTITPENNGIANIDVSGEWNATKIEWNALGLFVNDKPGLTEELTWAQAQGQAVNDERTWGEIANIAPSLWTPRGDLPLDVEQYEEISPTWETGVPEGEADTPAPDYSDSPRTWGRILYEQFDV